MSTSRFTFPLSLVGLALVFMPLDAHAYLDPGSGSYVIQVAVASLLGGLFALKTYWQSIKLRLQSFFNRSKPEKEV